MLNINGKTDSSYRYKMPAIKSSINGKGNGIFTLLYNIDDICKYLNHPDIIILKYLSIYFGSMLNETKISITGGHTPDQLQKALQTYINKFILCPLCNIPETIPILKKESKKTITLELKCLSCCGISTIICNGKIESKIEDIIIKYLEKNEWITSKKGMMVSKIESSATCDIVEDDEEVNPFSI